MKKIWPLCPLAALAVISACSSTDAGSSSSSSSSADGGTTTTTTSDAGTSDTTTATDAAAVDAAAAVDCTGTPSGTAAAVCAATAFLATLTDAQRSTVVYAFTNNAAKTVWSNLPGVTRNGMKLARIFEPFYRSARGRARQVGGLGLGLGLVKRIAEHHGGEVRVALEPGRTSFVLALPIPAAPLSAARAAPPGPGPRVPY